MHEASCVERLKPDDAREVDYRARNRHFLVARLSKRLGDIHTPFECDLISDVLKAVADFNELGDDSVMADVLRELSDVSTLVTSTALRKLTKDEICDILDGKVPEPNDSFVRVAKMLYPRFSQLRDLTKSLLSERDLLQSSLLELQRLHSSETFYPDANSTLRISAGHVEGYSAADAVWCEPTTTLLGLREKSVEAMLMKTSGSSAYEQFSCPDRLNSLLEADTSVEKIPVNILYSTDTVGGNSGSPVLSAEGEFVAINFDRQRQGLMNEFKWSHEYSRSIGVDVRYILWLIGVYDNAPQLVREMLRQN